jgi:ATP-dependent DNA ligase
MKPMLAHNWDRYKDKIKYPCIVQPKYDGIRCLTHREGDTITYWSRAEKPLLNLSHLDKWCLDDMADGDWLDGELYKHDIGFQNICSYVKKLQPGTKLIEYHVYDIIKEGVDYLYRVDHPHGYIAEDSTEVDVCHTNFVSEGYEGSMIRNLTGFYKHGRSFDLLKRKDWFDEEYVIQDVVEGKGKFKGCAVFICSCGNTSFSCTSPGSVQNKQAHWKDKENLIGKEVTVKYQEKTDQGIPRFPIALAVRNYE